MLDYRWPYNFPMPDQPGNEHPATPHIVEAHSLLKELRKELDQHPQLEEAILRLEAALAELTRRSGGLL